MLNMQLTEIERQLCYNKMDKSNQLAFGVMLMYFREYKEFPDNSTTLSKIIIQISLQLKLDSIHINNFDWNGRNAKQYRSEIRTYYGYRIITETDKKQLITYLSEELIPQDYTDAVCIEQMQLYLQKQKIEVCSENKLLNYINQARQLFKSELLEKIYKNLSSKDIELIDSIVEPRAIINEDTIELNELKKDIAGVKIKNIKLVIDKVNLLQKIIIPDSVIKTVDRKILVKYYERIMALSPSHIKDFSVNEKYASIAIFCHIRREVLLDSLGDIFIKLVKRIQARSEQYVDDYIVKEIKRVDGKFATLEKLAIINHDNPKAVIEDKVYDEVPKEQLRDIIEDLSNRGKGWYHTKVKEKMYSIYSHSSRQSLLSILSTLELHSSDGRYLTVIEAIEYIKKYANSKYDAILPPLEDVISASWYDIAITTDNNDNITVNKFSYELAVLDKIKNLLSFKGVWIEKSYRYRNPKDDLINNFASEEDKYYKLLGLPKEARDFILNLKTRLSNKLDLFNANITGNSLVSIKDNKSGNNIKVTPSPAQTEPENIIKLQQEISHKWSSIHLIDILKECDIRINFTEQFNSISKSSSILSSNFQKRLLLGLFGIGSNTGLKRISIANEGISYDDLRYIKKRYINKYNIRNAIVKVINNILSVRDPKIWGSATTTVSCDSTHLYSWDQNLMSQWHYRYKKKGVMIYWHIDKKSLCIYSQLKTCSSSEVASMIKGILDHDTKMDMNRVFVDTHGQSTIGFAISHLLNFTLCTRFKGINKQKLFYVNADDVDKYSNLRPVLKNQINWKIIEDNYAEVVEHMVALKLGKVTPETLIKRFSKNNYNHPVYKALMEIGKVEKTIFLCEYLSSEDLRIEVNEGLTIVERMNFTMDFIFYGKLGQITTNNIEDQELSILCLHLLQVCMVYINTLIIQEILSQDHWHNKLTTNDYRALTPLYSGHINPYGIFPLDLDKRIVIGK